LILLLVFAALGPAKWQLRTGLGWRLEHVAGYFAFTLLFCFAWSRPIVVGGALMACAMLLEALQALTPDRSCNLEAALYGAGGALGAGLLAELFTRRVAPLLRRVAPLLNGGTFLLPRPAWPSWSSAIAVLVKVRGVAIQSLTLAGQVKVSPAVTTKQNWKTYR
jgi:hypothetical protein